RNSDMGGDFIRPAPVRESMWSRAEPDPTLAHGDRDHMLVPSKTMRLRVLYHGNCFDGCSSAGVFTRFYRERIAKAPVEVSNGPRSSTAPCFPARRWPSS